MLGLYVELIEDGGMEKSIEVALKLHRLRWLGHVLFMRSDLMA